VGWNDLDSLEATNSTTSGLSYEERQSVTTLWAMANAPMYLGGDLTALTDVGIQLLSNDGVIAVDQSGHPAKQVIGGDRPVWVSNLRNGNYYVALSNLNAFPSPVTLPWNLLGVASAAHIYDVWNHMSLPASGVGFTALIPGHGTRLLEVTGAGHVSAPSDSQSYEAESAILGGSASVANCPACSGGAKVGNFGLGANNTVTFNDVEVSRTGTY